MPAGNTTAPLRSGARPCAPLDFGPTNPFGRLDCLLLPLLPILSDRSTCDCALSTRTDRRWSDRMDPLWGGDAPTKDLESFCAAAWWCPVRAGGSTAGFRARKPWDGAPRPLSPFTPASYSLWGSPDFAAVSPLGVLGAGPEAARSNRSFGQRIRPSKPNASMQP